MEITVLRGIKLLTDISYDQRPIFLLEHDVPYHRCKGIVQGRVYACCVFLFTQMTWRQQIFPAEAITTLDIINLRDLAPESFCLPRH